MSHKKGNKENEKKNGKKEGADPPEEDSQEHLTKETSWLAISGKKSELSHGHSSKKTEHEPKKSKKPKRTIRFEDQVFKKSQESIATVKSLDHEGKIHSESFSILKRCIQAPLHRSQPRPALEAPSFEDFEPFLLNSMRNTLCLSSTSSSKQLFELLRNSPAPTKADNKLINSTLLKNLEGVKEALENGADVNTFREKHTPLLLATSLGTISIVRYLVTVPKVNINFQNFYGLTSVMIAVKNCFDEITLILLKSGADVNISDNMGRTPLHEALFQQRPKMTNILLDYGANYEKVDIFGERPMYAAAVKKPNLECLKALLNRGASPEYYNISGMTLLMRVILHCTEFSILEILVEHGALVNSPDLNTGKTPLHFSASISDLNITHFLLKHGADVNLKTFYNFTAFDEAIFHNNLEVAEVLFHLTANASQRALKGLRAKIKNENKKKYGKKENRQKEKHDNNNKNEKRDNNDKNSHHDRSQSNAI